MVRDAEVHNNSPLFPRSRTCGVVFRKYCKKTQTETPNHARHSRAVYRITTAETRDVGRSCSRNFSHKNRKWRPNSEEGAHAQFIAEKLQMETQGVGRGRSRCVKLGTCENTGCRPDEGKQERKCAVAQTRRNKARIYFCFLLSDAAFLLSLTMNWRRRFRRISYLDTVPMPSRWGATRSRFLRSARLSCLMVNIQSGT